MGFRSEKEKNGGEQENIEGEKKKNSLIITAFNPRSSRINTGQIITVISDKSIHLNFFDFPFFEMEGRELINKQEIIKRRRVITSHSC